MSLLRRAHDIMQAKANRALDAAERPDEVLDLSYEEMLEQLTQVRCCLIDIAAARKRIELQEQQLQHSVSHLQVQAEAALADGKDDLAKEALARTARPVQWGSRSTTAPQASRRPSAIREPPCSVRKRR